MLWNWYTIDACFISRGWHVRSKAQFAGSCIGVFLLVLAIELVRRAQREYDRRLTRNRGHFQAGGETSTGPKRSIEEDRALGSGNSVQYGAA